MLLVVLGLPLYAIARGYLTFVSGVTNQTSGGYAFDAVSSVAVPLAVSFAYLGASTISNERRSGTLVTTRLATPSLHKIFVAKLIAGVTIFCALSLVSVLLAQLLTRAIFFGEWSLAQAPIRQILLVSASMALFGVFGLAIGFMFRVATAMLLIGASLAVLPPALMMTNMASQTLANMFSISAVQAAATVAPAHPFPLEGMPVSTLTHIGGLGVESVWAFLAIVLASLRIRRFNE